MRHNGFPVSQDPILKPLDTIECRDALMNPDGTECVWPKVDVIVGNPPFLGDKLMRGRLGDDYVDSLAPVVQGVRVPGGADLVCYWFAKSEEAIVKGWATRAGLVATSSIREGRNRTVLDRIVQQWPIFDAWSDEPWVLEGAAVRVSQVCFGNLSIRAKSRYMLDGHPVTRIHADLTATKFDLTRAVAKASNLSISFIGNDTAGQFDVSGHVTLEWLTLPTNPNGRTNADVLKPRVNGEDLMARPSDRWIIDFGSSMNETDAALYEAPYSHVVEQVKPKRLSNRRKSRRERWWIHGESRPGMWRTIRHLPRFIVVPRTSQHRVFVWLEGGCFPTSSLVAIARTDATTFGILHSRFHEVWSLRLGSSLEDRPRYTPSSTFQTFPFPPGLEPNVPATDYAEDPRAIAIADAARNLVTRRDHWLNPPELVEWGRRTCAGLPQTTSSARCRRGDCPSATDLDQTL